MVVAFRNMGMSKHKNMTLEGSFSAVSSPEEMDAWAPNEETSSEKTAWPVGKQEHLIPFRGTACRFQGALQRTGPASGGSERPRFVPPPIFFDSRRNASKLSTPLDL